MGDESSETRGTPQGGVISPILSNLFLHYAFDLWMRRAYPDLPWCRYADDGLVHCRTEQEARGRQGRASGAAGRVPAGNASDQNQDRLLQRWQAQRQRIRTSSLTSSDTAFRPRWVRNSRRPSKCSAAFSRRSALGAEVHAGDGPGLEYSRNRPICRWPISPRAQSAPSGLDRILRPIHALGAGTHAPICQPDDAGLGDAEVQALCSASQGYGPVAFSKGWLGTMPGPLRALATRS